MIKWPSALLSSSLLLARLPICNLCQGTASVRFALLLSRASSLSPSISIRRRVIVTSLAPFHETGRARNKVSSRASAKPSPIYLPVAMSKRSSYSGIDASCAITLRRSLGFMPPWSTTRLRVKLRSLSAKCSR